MENNILNGLKNGFLDSGLQANVDYVPKLLINNPSCGEKVLTAVIKELKTCDEFMFCVAFLNMSGFQVLLKTLKELEDKNIKGKIIVSQYQNFTEPKALESLNKLANVELKIVTESEGNLHSKGYIFKKDNEYKIIVGSSNLTQSALCVNKEWNVKINSLGDGAYTKLVIDEFNKMWEIATLVDEAFIKEYEEIYKQSKPTEEELFKQVELKKYKPNKMQELALENLDLIRQSGENRALVVSSTGTGETQISERTRSAAF